MNTPCHKTRVLIDIKVEAEGFEPVWFSDDDDRWKKIERNIQKFHDFIKDHRSQDHIRLYPRRVYEYQCSACGSVWEPYDEAGTFICANCGAKVQLEEPSK